VEEDDAVELVVCEVLFLLFLVASFFFRLASPWDGDLDLDLVPSFSLLRKVVVVVLLSLKRSLAFESLD
jgi:hypothetical protein